MNRACGTFACVVAAILPLISHAAEPDRAQALFDEARRLVKAGDYASACPKFAESQKLQPAPGTLLNLARCHELEGKLATALREFVQVRTEAQSARRRDKELAAAERIAVIEKVVPHLTITVSESARVQGLNITVDGVAVPESSWGVDTTIDPGEHTIEVAAPDRKAMKRVVVMHQSDRVDVDVPVLERQEPEEKVRPVPSASVTATSPSTSNGDHSQLGYIVGGVGLVAIGVGTFFGIRAVSRNNESKDLCVDGCDAEGARLSRDAVRDARVADVAIALGLVGVGVGTYFVLSSGGRDESGKTTLRVQSGPTTAGVSLQTVW